MLHRVRPLMLTALVSQLVLTGCGKTPPRSPAAEQTPTTAATSELVKDTPANETPMPVPELEISAAELAEAFQRDSKAAAEKYVGKQVRLTGSLSAAPGQGGWDDRLSLTGYKPAGGLSLDLDCRLLPGEFARVQDLSVTQEITLTGEVVGRSAELVVSNGKIEKVSADPAIEITAQELTQAYLENAAAAVAKYDKKPVKLTGKIMAFHDPELEVHLEGHSATKGTPSLVLLRMGAEYGTQKDKLAVGDTIVVKGVASALLNDRLEITHAHLLSVQK